MPFADELIGSQTAEALAHAIHAATPDAELPALRAAPASLAALSLSERAALLRDALLHDIPGDYADLARVIRVAANGSPPFGGWLIWPVTSAVAQKAVEEGTDTAFDDAMALLAKLTPLLTSEFAIRTLLRHNLPRAMEIVAGWTRSDDAHVRRLASEGTRPYLPWSIRVPGLISTPGVTVTILDALYRDTSDFVRRSVANHLNDLSRDHPEIAVATARRWLEHPDENTDGVVRRGLRTLVKAGDLGALELLGFAQAALEVTGPVLSSTRIAFGGSVGFTASIRNVDTGPARLSIDYTVHHRKANGRQTGKTFKLAMRTLEPGEEVDVTREHSFRQITTRRYYPGAHAIEVRINGVGYGRATFELEGPAGPREPEGS